MNTTRMSSILWVHMPSECDGILMGAPQILELALPCTVLDALQKIGMDASEAMQLLQHHRVAIWGRRASMHIQLKPNDRIEILAPLIFNPMESRRRRAAHRARQAQQKV